jgi:hypothetical protein
LLQLSEKFNVCNDDRDHSNKSAFFVADAKKNVFDRMSDQRESDHSWHLSLVRHIATIGDIVPSAID